MSNSFFRIESLTGQPIKISNTELRVRSQVIRLRMPVTNGWLIWNRPIAVLVRMSDVQEQILPIQDRTRLAVLRLAGFCFASMFFLLLFRRHKAETGKNPERKVIYDRFVKSKIRANHTL